MKPLNSLVLIKDSRKIVRNVITLLMVLVPCKLTAMEQINKQLIEKSPFEIKLETHIKCYSPVEDQKSSKLRKGLFEITMLIEEAPKNQNVEPAIKQQESLRERLITLKKGSKQALSYMYGVSFNSSDIPQNLTLTQARYEDTITVIGSNRKKELAIEKEISTLTLSQKEKSEKIKNLESELDLLRQDKSEIDITLNTQKEELPTIKAALGLLCIQAQNYIHSMEKQKNELSSAQTTSKKTQELLDQVNKTLVGALKNTELFTTWKYRTDLENYIEDQKKERSDQTRHSSELPTMQEVGDFFSFMFTPKPFVTKKDNK